MTHLNKKSQGAESCVCSTITQKPLDNGHIITKLGSWIVHNKSWLHIVVGGDLDSLVDPA